MNGCKLENLSGSISTYDLLDNGVAASTAMFHRLEACGGRRLSEGGNIKEVCPDCPARRIKRAVERRRQLSVQAAV